MARPGIKEDDVLRAIEAIEVQGKTPTVREVNRILGTGSSATISRLMAVIRTKRISAALIDAKPPTSIQERVNALTQELWMASIDLATAENRRLQQKIHELSYGAQPIAEQLEDIVDGLRAHLRELHAAGDSRPVVTEPSDDDSPS